MADKMRDFIKLLTRELQSHGVTESHVEKPRRGAHPRLVFEYNNRQYRFVFPGTASDYRSLQNTLSDLRRAMGVTRVSSKSPSSPAPAAAGGAHPGPAGGRGGHPRQPQESQDYPAP